MLSLDQQLHKASELGNIELLLSLVDQGADINSKDRHGRTSLHLACYRDLAETLVAILNAGGDINATDCDGKNALQLACIVSKRNSVVALVAHGAVDGADRYARYVPELVGLTMHQAAVQGSYIQRLRIVLESCPSSNPKDQPEALSMLALRYSQTGSLAILQAYMAAQTIEEIMPAAHGMRVN